MKVYEEQSHWTGEHLLAKDAEPINTDHNKLVDKYNELLEERNMYAKIIDKLYSDWDAITDLHDKCCET